MHEMTRTATDAEGLGGSESEVEAQLIVLLNAASPTLPSSRHILSRIDRVSGGRGAMPSQTRTRTDLVLQLDDVWQSAQHLQLARHEGVWLLEDLGSRNRTYLAGQAASEEILADGDIVQAGATFFLFRAAWGCAASIPRRCTSSCSASGPRLKERRNCDGRQRVSC
jgi:pSer/pThr/pTyr-binding forkhead associated (FHA) protein